MKMCMRIDTQTHNLVVNDHASRSHIFILDERIHSAPWCRQKIPITRTNKQHTKKKQGKTNTHIKMHW